MVKLTIQNKSTNYLRIARLIEDITQSEWAELKRDYQNCLVTKTVSEQTKQFVENYVACWPYDFKNLIEHPELLSRWTYFPNGINNTVTWFLSRYLDSEQYKKVLVTRLIVRQILLTWLFEIEPPEQFIIKYTCRSSNYGPFKKHKYWENNWRADEYKFVKDWRIRYKHYNYFKIHSFKKFKLTLSHFDSITISSELYLNNKVKSKIAEVVRDIQNIKLNYLGLVPPIKFWVGELQTECLIQPQ